VNSGISLSSQRPVFCLKPAAVVLAVGLDADIVGGGVAKVGKRWSLAKELELICQLSKSRNEVVLVNLLLSPLLLKLRMAPAIATNEACLAPFRDA